MKTFLLFKDAGLRDVVIRAAADRWGLVLVDYIKEAELILCDHWIEPADTTRVYGYFGVRAAEYILPKWGYVAYPNSIPGYSNAYYLGIAEVEDIMPKLIGDRLATNVDTTRRVMVIVDDKDENIAEAKVAFPDAVCFNRPELALSFIRYGTTDVVAVLTDLVMPITPVTPYAKSWAPEEVGKLPSGILVYMAAKARGIPVAIVTSGHQASSLEEYFVYTFAEGEQIPLVNTTPKDAQAWKRAFSMLRI